MTSALLLVGSGSGDGGSRSWRAAARIHGAYLAQAVHERARGRGQGCNYVARKDLVERAMGLEPTTFSLGS